MTLAVVILVIAVVNLFGFYVLGLYVGRDVKEWWRRR